MKNFYQDFLNFNNLIKNRQPFAVSRCNDGEMDIMLSKVIIDRTMMDVPEYYYNYFITEHDFYREKLIESSQYKADNYYVGIACKCCFDKEKCSNLKILTGQDDEHLTWGNVFANTNYPHFLNKMMPEFNNFDVVLIVNKKSIIDKLPFKNKIVKTFYVGTNAWIEDYDLVDVMKNYIIENKVENQMFLFCAGPFSNILIYECFKTSPNNTYIDIGSGLDPLLGLGNTRGYLMGLKNLYRTCIWS